MSPILCCLKKDIFEIVRNKRIMIFNGLLIAISAMVLLTTILFPDLIGMLAEKAPDVMSDGTQIEQLMEKLFLAERYCLQNQSTLTLKIQTYKFSLKVIK